MIGWDRFAGFLVFVAQRGLRSTTEDHADRNLRAGAAELGKILASGDGLHGLDLVLAEPGGDRAGHLPGERRVVDHKLMKISIDIFTLL